MLYKFSSIICSKDELIYIADISHDIISLLYDIVFTTYLFSWIFNIGILPFNVPSNDGKLKHTIIFKFHKFKELNPIYNKELDYNITLSGKIC